MRPKRKKKQILKAFEMDAYRTSVRIQGKDRVRTKIQKREEMILVRAKYG